jgi:hypothetical protein
MHRLGLICVIFFSVACSIHHKLKGEAEYFVGEATNVFNGQHSVEKRVTVLLESRAVDGGGKYYSWFYSKEIGPNSVLQEIKGISVQTKDPLVYTFSASDAKLEGRLVFENEARDKYH